MLFCVWLFVLACSILPGKSKCFSPSDKLMKTERVINLVQVLMIKIRIPLLTNMFDFRLQERSPKVSCINRMFI